MPASSMLSKGRARRAGSTRRVEGRSHNASLVEWAAGRTDRVPTRAAARRKNSAGGSSFAQQIERESGATSAALGSSMLRVPRCAGSQCSTNLEASVDSVSGIPEAAHTQISFFGSWPCSDVPLSNWWTVMSDSAHACHVEKGLVMAVSEKVRARHSSWGKTVSPSPMFRDVVTLQPKRAEEAWAQLSQDTVAIELRELPARLHRSFVRALRQRQIQNH